MNNDERAKVAELKDALYRPALVVNVMPASEIAWFREYAKQDYVVVDGSGNSNGRDSGHFGFALAHIFKEFREYQELKLILIDQAGRETPSQSSPSNAAVAIKTLGGRTLPTVKSK